MILTVFTPTRNRPMLLTECEASVRAQTIPVQHVIVRAPDIGWAGVEGIYAAMPHHAHLATGDYVMVLNDDNVLSDPEFAHDFAERVMELGWPDVVMFKGEVGPHIQPLVWEAEPQVGHVDLSCFAVSRPVWQASAAAWGRRYEGDFDFIHHLWAAGYTFNWWDRMAFRPLQPPTGRPV